MTDLPRSGAGGTAICGALAALSFSATPALTSDLRFSPELSLEVTGFPDAPQFDDQLEDGVAALIATGEVTWRSDDRAWQVVLEPYLRWDGRDEDRSYGDLRRGFVRYLGDGWDVTVGADRVFWGVVESVNVVDVINQRDGLENADLDEKLGQPLLRFAAQTDYGDFDLYYLPYFRERAFPGEESRPRLGLPVDEDAARFERTGDEAAGDFAFRYSNRAGDFDYGLSYFYGTSRAPNLTFNPANSTLEPFYQTKEQVGLDVQYTAEAWLWKLEAARVSLGDDDFIAAVGGLEYTLFDVAGSGRDVGLITEYLHDGRDQTESPQTPFDNNVFLGTRITWNDVQDTEFLAGAIVDVEHGDTQWSAEFQRRIGENNLLEVELRYIDYVQDTLLEPFKDDATVTLRWSTFF